ncbi:MAG: AzlC family ABC transporter permease [Cocleimonas sp.]
MSPTILTPLNQQKSNRQSFLIGARDTLPLIIAAVPFAIVYGALAISQGLSEWMVLGMSIFVFAGASQFVAVTLMASATLFPVILLTVFIVNLRHILYAASLMPQLSKVSQWLRVPMAFWLTDETYAAVSNRFSQGSHQDRNGVKFTPFYLGSAIAMYSSWVFFSGIGITLGQEIPDITSWGLDIAMVVAFVGIVVPHLKNNADWACAITAGISALLTHSWPHQTGLLFSSFIAIAVGVLLSHKQLEDNQKVIK